MKYLSLNELNTFHCHDAEVGQIVLRGMRYRVACVAIDTGSILIEHGMK